MFSGRICLTVLFLFLLCCIACKHKKHATDKPIPAKEMDAYVQEEIESLLSGMNKKKQALDDSTKLHATSALLFCYAEKDEIPFWSHNKKWLPVADSLVNYLQVCAWDGLFKDDYQAALLAALKEELDHDSLSQTQPLKWARADVLLTDAWLHLAQDLKQGRLQVDSLSWLNQSVQYGKFFLPALVSLTGGETSLHTLVNDLQPKHRAYGSIREGIKQFANGMDLRQYTYVSFPYKDSIHFLETLVARIGEAGITTQPVARLDSAGLAKLVSQYQKAKGLKITGKISAELVKAMNNTDQEKFKRIAITLDKYKLMPGEFPEKYIWVNLPSYYLQLFEKDSLVLESKVIIGKPGTPTPDIMSQISDLVIYPTWTVPGSIIQKEILPGLKHNPNYLSSKGLGLYDIKGNVIDPHAINWSKYSKGIPYLVRQSSGDNNALGVIKFNFKNPYAVYLHDTNQRYLFKSKERSLSHGCVRVQEWQKLAAYIMRNDSMYAKVPDSLRLSADSVKSWISQKQRHTVPVREKVQLYITYFGCAGENGKIRFYDDVYNRDKALREKYFASK